MIVQIVFCDGFKIIPNEKLNFPNCKKNPMSIGDVVASAQKNSLVEKMMVERKPGGRKAWWKESLVCFKTWKKAWCFLCTYQD